MKLTKEEQEVYDALERNDSKRIFLASCATERMCKHFQAKYKTIKRYPPVKYKLK